MPLLRLLAIALYPACLLLVLLRRPRQAAAAAGAVGARVELGVWARSPRHLRVLVLVGGALLLSFAGRPGGALALAWALLTAPVAAAGMVQRITVTSRGLLVDVAFTPWSDLAGWVADRAEGRLLLLRREPAGAPIAIALGRRELAAAAHVLSAHLPEVRPP